MMMMTAMMMMMMPVSLPQLHHEDGKRRTRTRLRRRGFASREVSSFDSFANNVERSLLLIAGALLP